MDMARKATRAESPTWHTNNASPLELGRDDGSDDDVHDIFGNEGEIGQTE
jgi:hypothetical protein